MNEGVIDIAAAYKRFGHMLLYRCRVILRDEALAEDALQEVFVRVCRYPAAFARAAEPVRWLYRVTEHVCFDLLRHRFRQLPAVSELPVVLRDETDEPTALLHRDSALKLLRHLDQESQRLALLYYLDGLSQEEIGREMDFSRQTVNKKLGRLKQRLDTLRRKLGVR
jgi:RNA polymerase sigma-70 factor, ECF subfamily